MPRCHRYGIYNSNHHHRYGSYQNRGYAKNNLKKPISIELINKPIKREIFIKPKLQKSKDTQLNQRRFNDVELKIETLKSKINDEIDLRKNSIKNLLIENDECFTCQEGTIYHLTPEFLKYLLEKSKYSLLKQSKLKKTFRRLNFNLNKGFEDILIKHKMINIFSSTSFYSVLKVKSSDWKKWEDIIKLIGNNINQFKLSIKEKELEKLNDEFECIAFLEHEQKIKICEKCGLENNNKARYCYYCGNKI